MIGQTHYVFSTKETKRYRFPTHTNDLVMDRSESEASEVFLVVLEPGEAPPLHAHEDYEQLIYIMTGKGRLQINRDDPLYFDVVPGDVVRIPRRVLHRIQHENQENMVYLSIDCFVGGRPEAEPTWESHVRAICQANGWNFDEVAAKA